MSVAFANEFSSKNISIYAVFNDQSFNDTLTNDTTWPRSLKFKQHKFVMLENLLHDDLHVKPKIIFYKPKQLFRILIFNAQSPFTLLVPVLRWLLARASCEN